VDFLLTFLRAKRLIEFADEEDETVFKFADDVVAGLIGKETGSAKRVRAYRKRQKQIALQSNSDVTTCNTELEKELDLDSENKEHSAAEATPLVQLESEFDEVWSQYPNKKGKKQAFNHYKAWRKKSITHTNVYLLERLGLYKQDLATNRWKSPMNGATWFNGRFDDDYQVPNNSGMTPPITRKDWFGETS